MNVKRIPNFHWIALY